MKGKKWKFTFFIINIKKNHSAKQSSAGLTKIAQFFN